ncbi:MAG: hypothetical protein WKG00_27620 [Polyangiaceae bacterium]
MGQDVDDSHTDVSPVEGAPSASPAGGPIRPPVGAAAADFTTRTTALPAAPSAGVALDDTQSVPRIAPSAGPVPLDGLAYGIEYLDAIIVFYAGDAHVHAAWVRPETGFTAEEMAPRLRDAYRSCHAAARALETHSVAVSSTAVLSDAFVTLETPARITFLRRVRGYVVAVAFDAAVPLGMARMLAGRLVGTIGPELPREASASDAPRPADEAEGDGAKTLAVPQRPRTTRTSRPPPPPRPTSSELDRARRLLQYAEEHAVDAHVVRQRIALRAGLTPLALEHPEALGADAIVLIENAVADILGLDQAALRSST